MTEPGPVEVSVHIAARPETVFAYFTDPTRYAQWMGNHATLEPVPGGSYRVHLRDGVQAAGEFVEIDPPRRVVFTWGWEGNDAVPPGTSTVEVTLEPDGDATILRLVHRDLPEPAVQDHAHGWDLYLGRLVTAGAGGDAGPDPNAG